MDMLSIATLDAVLNQVEATLSTLHQQQVKRATDIARQLRPELTAEDLLNPDDYKEIVNDPRYLYEDGQAAGVLAAKIAVRALLKDLVEQAEKAPS